MEIYEGPLMEIIRKRKSVRKYIDTPVEKEKIEAIIEAARLAPSSSNTQPWRFIAVLDKTVLSEIKAKGLGGIVPNKWASTTPAVIVACAELNIITHRIGATIKNIDYHLIDLGIATEHLILRATELGLGTCWIGWFNEKEIKKTLNIPTTVQVISLITIGYYEDKANITAKTRMSMNSILFYNKWKGQMK
ncbi:MAG: nitroreductase family protein [Candidatus Firestonebacteria bacterium]